MHRLLFALLSSQTVLCLHSFLEKANPYIMIEPVTSQQYGFYVVKRELEPLNLSCTVYNASRDPDFKYNISWILPRTSSKSKSQIITKVFGNSARLSITRLERNDEGRYACEASPLENNLESLRADVVVNIINGKVCAETMFTCNLSKYNNCIHRRFTCDGYQDCEMGEDEDQDMCGHDPCYNKLPCQDHISVVRCIPKAWCCNIKIDANCTVREPLSCCPNLFHNFMDDRIFYNNLKPHYYDMAFAVYTIIGCAMVFMVVVTVLVIAICRVYTRTQWSNTLPPRSTCLNESTAAMYEVDMYCRGSPGLLVAYNIDQELQQMGCSAQPPPYSEVVSLPPKQGPPPPYSLMDMSEAEALLNSPRTNSDQQDSAALSSNMDT